jgi:polyisoprenyl-phosphate glycosyltransferase
LKIAAVMPAYNEAARIEDVLSAVTHAPSIDEIVVVNDGSTDRTAEVVESYGGVRLVNLPANGGKGGAMVAGASATDADVLVFLDSDLIGLKPSHVEALVAPVRLGRAQMAVGRFQGGRKLTDWSQRLAPNISGQRAIRREVFERIPSIAQSRYGVEMAITRFCRHYCVPTETVRLAGVTHPMKEEKLGVVRGWASRARMYCEIMRIVLNPRAPRQKTPRPRFLRFRVALRRKQRFVRRSLETDYDARPMPRKRAFWRADRTRRRSKR